MAAKGLPVSPHVTIYAFPVVALSSITVRITGVLLSVGCTGIAGGALVGADVPAMMSTLGDMGALGYLAKFSVAFPVSYHFLGGCRHAVWDHMPEYVQNGAVEQVGEWESVPPPPPSPGRSPLCLHSHSLTPSLPHSRPQASWALFGGSAVLTAAACAASLDPLPKVEKK